MTEAPSNQKLATLTLITILIGGGIYVFTPDQFAHAFYCEKTNEVMVFQNLTQRNHTGLYSYNNVSMTRACPSVWQHLQEYCQHPGVDCKVTKSYLINGSRQQAIYGESCDRGECIATEVYVP